MWIMDILMLKCSAPDILTLNYPKCGYFSYQLDISLTNSYYEVSKGHFIYSIGLLYIIILLPAFIY